MFAKLTRWCARLCAAGTGTLFVSTAVISACTDDPVAPRLTAEPRGPQADVVAGGGPQIEAGDRFTCGIRTDARVLCWGTNIAGQRAVPTALRAKQISVGDYHACAVEPDGTVTCWGARPDNPDLSWVNRGQTGVPSGLAGVIQVAAGTFFTCALRADGGVNCWGDADAYGDVPSLSGITELAAGSLHACALKGDGTVVCWGANGEDQASPPWFLPRVTQLSAGIAHTCVLTATGTVTCWGSPGVASVPSGLTGVTQIASGGHTACALTSAGTVVCWGQNTFGQATPPAGLTGVIHVTVGYAHACALKADVSAVCWGSSSSQETWVPSLVNRAPVVSFPDAGPWTEGEQATIPATVVDPDGDPLTYTWTIDGASMQQPTPGPSLTVLFLDDKIFTVGLSVSDGQFTTDATRETQIRNAAPRLTAINAPAAPVAARTTTTISGTSTDLGPNDTHTGYVSWGRGMPFIEGFALGYRAFRATRSDLTAGIYEIRVRVKDNGGSITDSTLADFLVVYDPSAGYVAGKGAIVSPAGACQFTCSIAEGRASFGFTSRYENGSSTPTGSTQFVFKAGNLEFASTKYQWLVVSGARAQYKGDGTVNGGGSYGFLLTAVDGDLPGGTGADKFRIKIWDKASGLVVYDNQLGAADSAEPATAIATGSITIKK